jgi:hypothetical protein
MLALPCCFGSANVADALCGELGVTALASRFPFSALLNPMALSGAKMSTAQSRHVLAAIEDLVALDAGEPKTRTQCSCYLLSLRRPANRPPANTIAAVREI